MVAKAAVASTEAVVTIKAPRISTVKFRIVGTAPYVQCAFSQKAKETMMATMAAGSQAKSKRTRTARDYDADMKGATHYSSDGWIGIPAPSFRAAMIDCCRLIGFKMTLAKLAVFVEPDGLDEVSGQPLVKLDAPKPERYEAAVRNDNGSTDIRVRPMWRKWGATLSVRFDEDVFSLSDVTNLLARAGMQAGIGEGRPNSRMSYGQGWGTFKIEKVGN
jgi:hypothetical protein